MYSQRSLGCALSGLTASVTLLMGCSADGTAGPSATVGDGSAGSTFTSAVTVAPNESVPGSEVPTTQLTVEHLEDLYVDVSSSAVATRTVLGSVPIGSAAGQAGVVECQECDPYRPWAPIVAPDGSIVLCDFVNNRWLTIVGDVVGVQPWPEGLGVIGQPRLVEASLMVVPYYNSATQLATALFYELPDLASPVREEPILNQFITSVKFRGKEILVNEKALDFELSEPYPVVTPSFNTKPQTLTIEWRGQSRKWIFPDGYNALLVGSAPDGTVVVEVYDPTISELVFYRFGVTGQRASLGIGDNFAWNDEIQVGIGRVVQIELAENNQIEVVEYAI